MTKKGWGDPADKNVDKRKLLHTSPCLTAGCFLPVEGQRIENSEGSSKHCVLGTRQTISNRGYYWSKDVPLRMQIQQLFHGDSVLLYPKS